MVRLACALEWLSAIQVAVADPRMVLYYLSSEWYYIIFLLLRF